MRKIISEREIDMDMNKFYKAILNSPSIRDIPILHVLRVAIVVFEIINSGECFYKEEELNV